MSEIPIMRLVALGMADGQIEQADRCLCLAAQGKGLGIKTGPRSRDPLLVALEHMRSACGWMLTLSSARERSS